MYFIFAVGDEVVCVVRKWSSWKVLCRSFEYEVGKKTFQLVNFPIVGFEKVAAYISPVFASHGVVDSSVPLLLGHQLGIIINEKR